MRSQKEKALKLKRQIRDFLNKHIHDWETLRGIAELIGLEVTNDKQ